MAVLTDVAHQLGIVTRAIEKLKRSLIYFPEREREVKFEQLHVFQTLFLCRSPHSQILYRLFKKHMAAFGAHKCSPLGY